MHDNISGSVVSPPRFHDQIEVFLRTALEGESQQQAGEEPGRVGRPQTLPSLSLWMAVLVAVLRGMRSQRAIWRLLASCGLWSLPCYDIVDETVYKRLAQEGAEPVENLFRRISLLLAQWLEPAKQAYEQKMGSLAPFASEVIALDEMWADPVTRRLPVLRGASKGEAALLPGKIVALFDVRLHQWRAIEYVAQATQNCHKHARAMLKYVSTGALILADLGYFGFAWFDDLTDAGYAWVSRWKEETTYLIVHTYYHEGDTFDGLVWLGATDARAAHVVRLVRFRVGCLVHQYITNVRNPTLLPMREIARLYARRWDIELGFLTLKQYLGLHLLWSSKQQVIRAQVWACLIIAQILQAIRMEVAFRAEVDAFDVSLPLLIEYLPQFSTQGRDGISECVRQGARLGIIRPSSRLRVQAPDLPVSTLAPLPTATVLWYPPRYPADRHVKTEKQALAKADKARAKQAKAEAEQVKAQQAKADKAKAAQTIFAKALAAKTKADQTRASRPALPLLPGKAQPSWKVMQPWYATESQGK
jgi:Transposase DDE domain